jgi:hypothetical protein
VFVKPKSSKELLQTLIDVAIAGYGSRVMCPRCNMFGYLQYAKGSHYGYYNVYVVHPKYTEKHYITSLNLRKDFGTEALHNVKSFDDLLQVFRWDKNAQHTIRWALENQKPVDLSASIKARKIILCDNNVQNNSPKKVN